MKPHRQWTQQELSELLQKVSALEAESEGRRVELLRASEERREEWLRAEAAEAKLEAVMRRVGYLADAVKHAREAKERRGGMQVPYQDHFASATPSVLRDLDWHVKDIRGALVSPEPADQTLCPSPARGLRALCAHGQHSFSWREAGQACRYCGAPPKTSEVAEPAHEG